MQILYGSLWQIERQETVDSRYYPVGAAVEFLFGREFQESSFPKFSCLSQENRIFGAVVVE
jgi:hypothetical protein